MKENVVFFLISRHEDLSFFLPFCIQFEKSLALNIERDKWRKTTMSFKFLSFWGPFIKYQ